MKKVKSIVVGLIAGANVVTVLAMLLLGFSGYVSPASFPTVSSLGVLFPFALLANLFFLFLWLTFKWRMAWIPLLGFLVAYVPIRTYMPFNIPSAPPDDAIKIISYNVEGYLGEPNYKDGFHMIYRYLKEQRADIVCLQEDNDTWRKTEVFFDSIYAYNDLVKVSKPSNPIINRLGIHTRYPIIRKERIDYDSYSNGSVAWFLQVGADTLIVINNHLESTHLTKADREQYTQLVHGSTCRNQLHGRCRDQTGTAVPRCDSVTAFSHGQHAEGCILEDIIPRSKFYVSLGLALGRLFPDRRNLGGGRGEGYGRDRSGQDQFEGSHIHKFSKKR